MHVDAKDLDDAKTSREDNVLIYDGKKEKYGKKKDYSHHVVLSIAEQVSFVLIGVSSKNIFVTAFACFCIMLYRSVQQR